MRKAAIVFLVPFAACLGAGMARAATPAPAPAATKPAAKPAAPAVAPAAETVDWAFGEQGTFIVSADRLIPVFAVTSNQITTDENGTKTTTSESGLSLSFLWGNNSSATGTAYNVPRVGIDYAVIDNVTLGADIFAYFTLGGTSEVKTETAGVTQTTSTDGPSTTVFGIAPRGGYILPINSLLAFWPRGGFSVYSLSNKQTVAAQGATPKTTSSTTFTELSLNLDPQLVVFPISHFGLTAGLALDVPLTGSRKHEATPAGGSPTSSSVDYSAFHFGVTAGLLGYF